jgi:hypothetical protein
MVEEGHEAGDHSREGRSGSNQGANQPRCSASQSKSARSYRADNPSQPRQRPIEDLEPVFEIEFTEPGSALDAGLREEQAKAVFDLLSAHRRRHPD